MELIQNILVTALLGIWACLSIGFFVWLVQGMDSNELTAILARLGWKRLDSKVRIPLYGPQYVFVPKECS